MKVGDRVKRGDVEGVVFEIRPDGFVGVIAKSCHWFPESKLEVLETSSVKEVLSQMVLEDEVVLRKEVQRSRDKSAIKLLIISVACFISGILVGHVMF